MNDMHIVLKEVVCSNGGMECLVKCPMCKKERWVRKSALKNRKTTLCKEYAKVKFKVGYIGQTTNGLQYEVVDRINDKITIKFTQTGYIKNTNSATLCNGYIKDKLLPSVSGVGYLGYCEEPIKNKEHNIWKDMISRCYNKNDTGYYNYGAKGVTVDERWHCFANFLEDITKIDGYDYELFYKGELDLDKDIKQKYISPSKKVYSLETCMFVNKHINRGMHTRRKTDSINILSIKDNFGLYTCCPVEDLGNEIGVKTQYINRILNGGAKTHDGWIFMYF